MDKKYVIDAIIKQVDSIKDYFNQDNIKTLSNRDIEILKKYYNLFLHINLIMQYDSFTCFKYEEIIDNFKKKIVND